VVCVGDGCGCGCGDAVIPGAGGRSGGAGRGRCGAAGRYGCSGEVCGRCFFAAECGGDGEGESSENTREAREKGRLDFLAGGSLTSSSTSGFVLCASCMSSSLVNTVSFACMWAPCPGGTSGFVLCASCMSSSSVNAVSFTCMWAPYPGGSSASS